MRAFVSAVRLLIRCLVARSGRVRRLRCAHHAAKPTLRIESSKGELGVYFISDGSEYPWRAKLRGPSFVNLQILPELLRGHKMSDVIAIMGSLDIVLGEVDR